MADSFDPYVQWLGISTAQRPVDHYTLLGLPRFETDPAAIASAAQQRMALVSCHSGGRHDAEAGRLSAELTAARDCLLDPRQKRTYDDALHLHVGSAPGHVPMQAPSHLAAPPVAPPEATSAHDRDAPAMQMGGYAAPPPAEKGKDTEAVEDEETPPTSRRKLLVIAGMLVLAFLLLGGFTTGLVLVLNRDAAPEPETDADAAPPTGPDGAPATADGPLPVDGGTTDSPLPGQVEIIRPAAGDVLEFTAAAAELHGPELRRETRQAQEVITNWTSPDNWLTWRFDLDKPGVYQVQMTYAATSGRGEIELTAEGVKNPLHVTLRSKGTGGQLITEETKPIAFANSGMKTLTLRADSIPGDDLMTLQSIRMTYDARLSGSR